MRFDKSNKLFIYELKTTNNLKLLGYFGVSEIIFTSKYFMYTTGCYPFRKELGIIKLFNNSLLVQVRLTSNKKASNRQLMIVFCMLHRDRLARESILN